jgi:DNA-binding beta-propeller fold protein YncE
MGREARQAQAGLLMRGRHRSRTRPRPHARRGRCRGAAVLGVAGLLFGAYAPAAAQSHPTYWAYVANESSDLVSLVRFDGREVVEENAIPVGFHPADLDGAHGITVSPTGQHWYVSIAHGQPYGQIWKMETGSDAFVDTATVGLFPATMSTTPDGASLFVVNFNLHGDPVPSSVSAVFAPFMSEVSKVETCVMPHGSRVSRDGRRHYSTCMMSDQLVETDVAELSVSRRLVLTAGRERVLADDHAVDGHAASDRAMAGRAMGGAPGDGMFMSGMDMSAPGICKPTWVVLSPDDSRLYVLCNGRGDVLEIDGASLEVLRRSATGTGPYNADVTPDRSTLVVSLKGDQAVAIIDLATGGEPRVRTTQPVTHGVAVTPDGRYAFVSNEAVGATRGTVDVIDLAAGAVAASVALHYQPGGLGFWKMEDGGR